MSDHPETKSPDGKQHMFDNPKNVKRVIHILYALCFISVIAEFFVHRHIDHPWEALFGFYALYGCIACVVLVLVATELRKLIMRDENYYDD